MPEIVVDRDSHRPNSRWQNDLSGWLIYEHRNVYHGERPMPILDDFPGNFGIQRKLDSADGLSLEVGITLPDSHPAERWRVETAFWNEGKTRIDTIDPAYVHGGQTFVFKTASSTGSPASANYDIPPLTPIRPIGLRIRSESIASGAKEVSDTDARTRWRISELIVRRHVLYRIDARSDFRETVLGDDQWFVVGDNVPLSVDSRTWGSVAGSQMIGRIDSVSVPLSALPTGK